MSSSPRTEASQFVYVNAADLTQTDSATTQNWVMVEDMNAVSESERQRLDRIEQAQTEAIAKRVIQQQQSLAPASAGSAPVAPVVNSETILVALAAAEAEEASKMAFQERRRQEDRASLELIASMQAGTANKTSPSPAHTHSSPHAASSSGASCSCLGASAGIHRKDCPLGGRP
jgi:hypothetical protein